MGDRQHHGRATIKRVPLYSGQILCHEEYSGYAQVWPVQLTVVLACSLKIHRQCTDTGHLEGSSTYYAHSESEPM